MDNQEQEEKKDVPAADAATETVAADTEAESENTDVKPEQVDADAKPEQVDADAKPEQADADAKPEPAGADAAEPVEETQAEPDWKAMYARTMADFDNFRKRTARDREELFKSAAGNGRTTATEPARSARWTEKRRSNQTIYTEGRCE